VLIGYACVSTDDQLLDLQQDALTKVGCERIFIDRESGDKATRPGLTLALDILWPGDTLVVWRLDRLGRSLKNLIELTELLRERSIQLHSIQEGIDTSTSGGQFVRRQDRCHHPPTSLSSNTFVNLFNQSHFVTDSGNDPAVVKILYSEI
jgi:DNA invertase Pin-like site-specific DNA recombinase